MAWSTHNGNHTASAKKMEKNRMETKSQKHGCSVGFRTPCAAAKTKRRDSRFPVFFILIFTTSTLG